MFSVVIHVQRWAFLCKDVYTYPNILFAISWRTTVKTRTQCGKGRWSTYFGIAISPMRPRYTYHYSSISGTTNNNITTRTPPSGVVRPRLFWRHTHKSDDLLSASSHTHGIMRVMPSQSWYIPLPSSFVASSHALQQYRDRLLQRHPV